MLPEGAEIMVGYDGMKDIRFYIYKMIDGKIDYLSIYWLDEKTGEVYNDYSEYVGILFD